MAKLDIILYYRQQKGSRGWIYYNPEADILYFRHRTASTSTMFRLFCTGVTIPRVAIDIECPKFVPRGGIRFGIVGPRIRTRCQTSEEIRLDEVMSILYSHGPKNTYIGCRGLRDVFWVETNNLDLEFQTIDESVSFRPLEPAETTDRGTEHMDAVMKHAEADKCTEQHHLSKLCLNLGSTKVYQRVFLHIEPYIQGFVSRAIKRVRKSSGCDVSLSWAGRLDNGLRVLKFLGRPESVERAMQAFADERARFNEKAKQSSNCG